MTTFLHRLAERTLGTPASVQPRLASAFEPRGGLDPGPGPAFSTQQSTVLAAPPERAPAAHLPAVPRTVTSLPRPEGMAPPLIERVLNSTTERVVEREVRRVDLVANRPPMTEVHQHVHSNTVTPVVQQIVPVERGMAAPPPPATPIQDDKGPIEVVHLEQRSHTVEVRPVRTERVFQETGPNTGTLAVRTPGPATAAPSTPRPSPTVTEPPPRPVIKVSIGRVVFSTNQPERPPPRRVTRRPAPAESLSDYLSRKGGKQ